MTIFGGNVLSGEERAAFGFGNLATGIAGDGDALGGAVRPHRQLREVGTTIQTKPEDGVSTLPKLDGFGVDPRGCRFNISLDPSGIRIAQRAPKRVF